MPALPMPDVSPAGEQHDIGHGRQHVVVTEVGATLRSYTVDGAPVIDGFGVTDMCSSGRGQVLAPWPNRLGDGRYSIDGRTGRVAWDEPERRNAIHGLVRWLPWHLRSRAQNVVVLGCTLFAQPAYPWRLEFVLEYRLGREGLVVTAGVTNADEVPARSVWDFIRTSHSVHPPSTPSGSRCPAHAAWSPMSVVCRRGTPSSPGASSTSLPGVGSVPHNSTPASLLYPVMTVAWLASISMTPSPDAVSPSGWTSTSGYAMAYTADTVEPAGRRRQAIAIEPMTCPPDALRSGPTSSAWNQGLLGAPPGESPPADAAWPRAMRAAQPSGWPAFRMASDQDALIARVSAQELRSSRGNGARRSTSRGWPKRNP